MSNFPPLAPPKACDSQEGIKCTKAKEQLSSYCLIYILWVSLSITCSQLDMALLNKEKKLLHKRPYLWPPYKLPTFFSSLFDPAKLLRGHTYVGVSAPTDFWEVFFKPKGF